VKPWRADPWTITRVADPDFELVLSQDEATTAALQRSPWLQPSFVTDDWSLRIGSSCIVLRDGARTVLVDPFLAFDDPARHAPRLAALADAGVDPDEVDLVVNTHVDGHGANLDPSTGDAAFPKARYVLPAADPAAGELPVADLVDAPVELAPGLELVDLPGHGLGHAGVLVGTPPAALVVGHLFLHPAQIANPDVADLDVDPATTRATRRDVLARCEAERLLLIGPLFEAPGADHVHRAGEGTWELQPAG
jgi:glyoxylase-like metal-dependent hydrolase (beta-lactamase superfamily II)